MTSSQLRLAFQMQRIKDVGAYNSAVTAPWMVAPQLHCVPIH